MTPRLNKGSWEEVLAELKKEWRAFRKGRPGQRFQEHHKRVQRERAHKPLWIRAGLLLVGCGLLTAGMILLVFPGPGLPLVALGAGILGGRFRPLAEGLDWLEVRMRKLYWRGKNWLKRSGPIAKA